MIDDPILREVFVQWGAWQSVVDHLLPAGADARTADPADVADALGDLDGERLRRLAHLLVAHAHADTVDEAVPLLGELWALALLGRRPRFGAECGLSVTDFGETS